MTAVIQTDGSTKAYGAHREITELDLDVQQGEIFGFLGPNGAGKTTTMRVCSTLSGRRPGRAEVFGIETTGTRWRSTGASATCPASSTCTTG